MKSKRAAWTALVVLTAANLLNYIDRNIISALAPAIQKDLQLTDTQLGWLGSGFIFAYLFISPVFGILGDRGHRNRWMGAGLALWSGATAFSGVALTFSGQMLTRIIVGVGEAAYSCIAPTVLADFFSRAHRGKVFAVFSGAVPIGSALGYVLGGWLQDMFGWQKTFFVVGLPGLLVAVTLLFLADPTPNRAEKSADGKKTLSVAAIYKYLFSNRGFLFVVLGYAAYTFVVGGLAFWMPSYIVRYFDISLGKGTMIFGAVSVAGGFFGTFIGGWWADRIERRKGNGYLKVSIWSVVITAPLFSLCLAQNDFTVFCIILFFMEVAMFLCMSPLDTAVINYVRPGTRASAMALNVFLIHLLGDGISRVMIGGIADSSDLRTAIGFCPYVLLLAGLIWYIGLIFNWQCVPTTWKPKVLQAHRGFWQNGAPENSLNAFRLAQSQGAEMIELDVHLSKDHVPMVYHDPSLRRLHGRAEKVRDLTAAELRALGIPALEDVLMDPLIPNSVNIEIKCPHLWRGHWERAIAKVVNSYVGPKDLMFSSFNPLSLRRLSRLCPNVPRGVAWSPRDGNVFSRSGVLLYLARAHFLHADRFGLSDPAILRLRDRGVRIAAWTVNSLDEAKRMLALGVESVISDAIVNPIEVQNEINQREIRKKQDGARPS